MGIFERIFGGNAHKEPNTHDYTPPIDSKLREQAKVASASLNKRNPNGIVPKVPSEKAKAFAFRSGDQDIINAVNSGVLSPTEGTDIIRAKRHNNLNGK